MLRWFLRRLLLVLPTLLGITFVVFLVLDLAPTDRARADVARRTQQGELADQHARAVAVTRLQIRYGLIDPQTLERIPLWRRYLHWLGNALQLRLAGPDEDQAAFSRRLWSALQITLLLGSLALLVAIVVGVPLGAYAGMHTGSRGDRATSAGLFVAMGVPDFLLATLLLLGLGGAWFDLFPAAGLQSDAAANWAWPRRLFDRCWHLVLPVGTLAMAPTVLITRFLRESVARAADEPFAANLRAWGCEPGRMRWRLLRAGAAPLATLAGSLLPMLVAGSIVVEQTFSLEGIGRLTWRALQLQDQPMVMAMTLLSACAILTALCLSDLAHRLIDPRVRVHG